MNIMITGGCGYIGSHVAISLEKLGHNITIYDNFSNSSKEQIKRLNLICTSKIDYICADITDIKSLKNNTSVSLNDNLSITPFLVPHRDEFSETVGYFIKKTGGKVALYIPDIDKWNIWNSSGPAEQGHQEWRSHRTISNKTEKEIKIFTRRWW